MKIHTVALFAVLFSGNIFAVSIVYNGFKCQNTVNSNDATPAAIQTQSRFEVIEDVGDGVFRLKLTGGLPRFTDNSPTVCIDSDTALGFSGIGEVDVMPRQLNAIDATAYYNGQDLMITVNSINSDLSSGRSTFSRFTTSLVFPISNTLILKQDSQSSSFKLKKIIHNRGFVHTSGATNSTIPFFETVLPSFGDSGQDKPIILTPGSAIQYVFE
ncbi:MAG: hypothetical protein Q8K59_05125 [Nitrosomonas sp.]|nr:hypothetical protein [Nitrosomonas sp.]MDP1950467.1 hypothetical protein [Nitrosomonas sp.]